MVGELKDLTLCRDGGQLLTIKVHGDARGMFDELNGKQVSIDIKEHHPRRSLNANAYFHVLVNQLAKKLGIGNDECKRRLVFDYGSVMRSEDGRVAGIILPQGIDSERALPDTYAKWYADNEINGKKVGCYLLYTPTHLMDSKEMARLIDGTISECNEFGIETMTPAELARLNGYERSK